MTRKDVLEIIAANPGKNLFASFPVDEGGRLVTTSNKTRLVRNAEHLMGARVGTWLELVKPGPKDFRIIDPDQLIVLFTIRKK